MTFDEIKTQSQIDHDHRRASIETRIFCLISSPEFEHEWEQMLDVVRARRRARPVCAIAPSADIAEADTAGLALLGRRVSQ